MNVLVLGVSGMFGHVLYDTLVQNPELNVYGYSRSESTRSNFTGDIYDLNWNMLLKKHEINVVVNCIGVLNNRSDLNTQDYILINSALPVYLAKLCENRECQFIHISTDCVFDGKNGPYKITDRPNATDDYGFSKILGEACLHYESTCILRTSIIGLEEVRKSNSGLLHWLLSQKSDEVKGYTQVFWNGITTNELAHVTMTAIMSGWRGLVIPTCENPISKYELLHDLVDIFKLNLRIVPSDEPRSNKVMKPSGHIVVQPIRDQLEIFFS